MMPRTWRIQFSIFILLALTLCAAVALQSWRVRSQRKSLLVELDQEREMLNVLLRQGFPPLKEPEAYVPAIDALLDDVRTTTKQVIVRPLIRQKRTMAWEIDVPAGRELSFLAKYGEYRREVPLPAGTHVVRVQLYSPNQAGDITQSGDIILDEKLIDLPRQMQVPWATVGSTYNFLPNYTPSFKKNNLSLIHI